MSNNYDFDAIKVENPTIKMGGHDYTLEYPTMEEIEAIEKLKDDEDKNNGLYQFIKKNDDSAPDFKDVLKKQNIKVIKAFTEMVKKEFGVDGAQ